MKKIMKKGLALVLCALMIVTAALPVLAVDNGESTTTHDGKIVITEIVNKAALEVFNYIEILNVSSETVDLSEYYLYVFGFDNETAKWGASSTEQLLGLANRGAQNIAAVQLNGTIEPGQVKLVMINDGYFDNQAAEGATSAKWRLTNPTYFVAYWNGLGANITVDDVIDIDIPYTLSARYIHSSTDAETESDQRDGDPAHDHQHNLLPRNSFGTCSVALIPADKAIDHEGNPVTTSGVIFDGSSSDGDQRSIKNILEGADSIVLLNTLAYNKTSAELYRDCHDNYPLGKAINFYSYIEEESFNAAVDATVYRDSTAKNNKKVYYYDDLYPSLETTGEYEAQMNFDSHKQGTVTQAIPMPKVRFEDAPTPGMLLSGQFISGKLAISEIAPNPTEGANFEYIEVINAGENTVNLKDYYIYRYTFSHGGKSARAGLSQLLGQANLGQLTNSKVAEGAEYEDDGGNTVVNVPKGDNGTTRVSLAEISGKTTLTTTDGPLVIYLQSDTSKDVAAFVEYWNENSDSTITAANVAVVDVSDYSVGSSKSTFGTGFLPDYKCGYIVSFVNKAFAEITDNTAANRLSLNADRGNVDYYEISSKTKARHNAADTIAVVYAFSQVPGKVANRYGFFDEEGFKIARSKTGENETPIADTYLYDSLMMPRPDVDGGVDVVPIADTYGAYKVGDNKASTSYFMNPICYEEPTPGALVEGQFDGATLGSASNVETEGLAITELMPASKVDGTGSYTADWEFIEVTNTKKNTNVTLTDYRLTLAGWTDNGGNDHVFYQRWFEGASSTNAKGRADVASVWTISVGADGKATATPASTSLASGKTAVIWFKNSANAADVAGFANYWIGRGSDMNGVTVAVATYVVGTSIDNGETKTTKRGNGFIPDAKFSFAICLVDSNKNVDGLTAALENFKSTATAGDSTKYRLIEQHADSIVTTLHGDYAEANVSCNYYGYIDQTKYAHDAMYYAQNIQALGSKCTAPIYAVTNNTVVMKDQPLRNMMAGGGAYGTAYKDGTASVTDNATNRVYIHTAYDSVPTPGQLVNGQFGYKAESELVNSLAYQTGVADGVNLVRIIGDLDVAQADLAKYDYIGIEVAAAQEATNARTSDDANNVVDNKANSICTEWQTFQTDMVYKTLTDKAVNVYTNEDGYKFAITISGIPTNNCNLMFRVFVIENGVKTYVTGMYQITDTSN